MSGGGRQSPEPAPSQHSRRAGCSQGSLRAGGDAGGPPLPPAAATPGIFGCRCGPGLLPPLPRRRALLLGQTLPSTRVLPGRRQLSCTYFTNKITALAQGQRRQHWEEGCQESTGQPQHFAKDKNSPVSAAHSPRLLHAAPPGLPLRWAGSSQG